MTSLTIYHNPRCSKSRNTLALIQEANVDVNVVEYLKTPPTASELTQILSALNLKPAQIMRKNETEYKDSGLDSTDLSEAQQIELMVSHPKVIERPIVIKANKAIIGRPPENVLSLL